MASFLQTLALLVLATVFIAQNPFGAKRAWSWSLTVFVWFGAIVVGLLAVIAIAGFMELLGIAQYALTLHPDFSAVKSAANMRTGFKGWLLANILVLVMPIALFFIPYQIVKSYNQRRKVFSEAGRFSISFISSYKFKLDTFYVFHRILVALPQCKKSLKLIDNIRQRILIGQQNGMKPAQVALALVPLALGEIINRISAVDRGVILRDLKEYAGSDERQFDYFVELFVNSKNEVQSPPKKISMMALILGVSFWNAINMVRENEVTQVESDLYITSVIGLLEGNSHEDKQKQTYELVMSAMKFDRS